jgi:CDP-diacylglycerol--glycerol-3-phosphate 3-phosphatidyltransferase
MFITLANKITLLRIFNVPLFILLLLYYRGSVKGGTPYEPYLYFATGLFTFTILLDVIDGHLARKRNEITRLGSVLDPIADKALLISSFIILSSNSIGTSHPHLPLWFVILGLSRDFVLVTGALLINYLAGSIKVHSRIFGKAATFFQTMVVLLVLFRFHGNIFLGGVVLAAFFTVVSGIQYIIDGYHQVEKL